MIAVHHLGDSQSDRTVWLCEELEPPYELSAMNETQRPALRRRTIML